MILNKYLRSAGRMAVLLCVVFIYSCSKEEPQTQDQYSSGWAVGNRVNNIGLLLRSGDRGLSWEKLTPYIVEGVDLYDVETVTEKEAWVVGSTKDSLGFIIYTEDGGVTWTRSGVYLMVPAVNLRDIFIKNNVMLVAGDSGTLLKSTDHGFLWQQVYLPNIPRADYTCITGAGKNIWIGGTVTDSATSFRYGIVICSHDGGLTWIRQGSEEELPLGITDIAAVTESAVYVSGWETVKYSLHAGDSLWTTRFYKPEVNMGGICVSDTNDLWIGASDQTIYHLNSIFDSIHSPYHGSIFRGMTCLGPSHIWACGSYDNNVMPLVMSSSTGGKSWFSGTIESAGIVNRLSFMNDLK